MRGMLRHDDRAPPQSGVAGGVSRARRDGRRARHDALRRRRDGMARVRRRSAAHARPWRPRRVESLDPQYPRPGAAPPPVGAGPAGARRFIDAARAGDRPRDRRDPCRRPVAPGAGQHALRCRRLLLRRHHVGLRRGATRRPYQESRYLRVQRSRPAARQDRRLPALARRR